MAELRQLRPGALQDYLASRRLRSNCERELQVAIQCALDIGNHIIAEENLTAPEDQADIFHILGASGILPLHSRIAFCHWLDSGISWSMITCE